MTSVCYLMVLQAGINLSNGIGISLVSHTPEEIMYISFGGIDVTLKSEHDKRYLDVRVANIQVSVE